jgi:hypothetical protein
MKKKTLIVSIDRVEGSTAIAETDDGLHFEVPVKSFDEKPSEGMIYRVPLDRTGNPDWPRATRDPAEESKRKADLTNRMANLRKRDPGGDIKL